MKEENNFSLVFNLLFNASSSVRDTFDSEVFSYFRVTFLEPYETSCDVEENQRQGYLLDFLYNQLSHGSSA